MKRQNTNLNLPLLALLPDKIKFDILKHVSIEDIFAIAEVSKASRAFIVSEYDLLSCLIRDFGPHLGYHHATTSSLNIRNEYMMSHFEGEKVKGYRRGAGRPDYEKASPVLKFILGPDIRESKDIKQPWKLWYTIRHGVDAYRKLSFESRLLEFEAQKKEQIARNDAMFARRRRLGLDLEDVGQHKYDDNEEVQNLDSRSDQREDRISDNSSDDFEDVAEQKSSNNDQEFEHADELPRGHFSNLINSHGMEITATDPIESSQEFVAESSSNKDHLKPGYSFEAYHTTSKRKRTNPTFSKLHEEIDFTTRASDAGRILSTSPAKVAHKPLNTAYENIELFQKDILGDGTASAEGQSTYRYISACPDEDRNGSECDPEEFLLFAMVSNVPSFQANGN